MVVIDPNNPTGAVYPRDVRRALLDFADSHGLLILADEVYGDLGFDGPVEPLGILDPDAAIISFSSLSKAYLAPGWRTGWMAIGRSPRLDDLAGGGEEAGRRPALQHGADAVRDRRRRSTATGRIRSRSGGAKARADLTISPALRDAGRQLRRADGGVLRDAARHAAEGQDRRGLREGAAARDGRAVRLRLRLRPAG